MNSEKFKWYSLLMVAIGLFVTNLFMQNLLINGVIIILAGIIYHYGSPILFKEYNDRQKQKLQASQEIRAATREVLSSGKLFKK
ncbi:hypothetical protein [Candidatus Enterococcus myersii]|uniref:hypothetical protein n=1 Tax=Candidatus Enterococcus myersii TaxID=2815322 RepID=UPI001F5FF378|nr:hypothetical protein [Enterococcus sp. MJM12]